MKRVLAVPLLLLISACAPLAGRRDAAPREPSAAAEAWMEMMLHDAVNQHRTRIAAVPALEYDEVIAAAARRHSRDMAEGRVPFGHSGFQERREMIRMRSYLGELGEAAENVGYTDFTAGTAVAAILEGFVRSPGHRRNLEGGAFTRTGIGVARSGTTYFVTQIFAR